MKKMVKCIFCGCQIDDERAVDVCDKCGKGVWGEKCFNAIKQNMSEARTKGDLHQGLININVDKSYKVNY